MYNELEAVREVMEGKMENVRVDLATQRKEELNVQTELEEKTILRKEQLDRERMEMEKHELIKACAQKRKDVLFQVNECFEI